MTEKYANTVQSQLKDTHTHNTHTHIHTHTHFSPFCPVQERVFIYKICDRGSELRERAALEIALQKKKRRKKK